jgi:GDP-D-mannose dehydratase
MPKALITGITGQDGSYLAELLLSKSYEVHGMPVLSTPNGSIIFIKIHTTPQLECSCTTVTFPIVNSSRI